MYRPSSPGCSAPRCDVWTAAGLPYCCIRVFSLWSCWFFTDSVKWWKRFTEGFLFAHEFGLKYTCVVNLKEQGRNWFSVVLCSVPIFLLHACLHKCSWGSSFQDFALKIQSSSQSFFLTLLSGLPAESLPQKNTGVIVAAVCGAMVLLVIIAVAACIIMRVLHSRHEYEGWVPALNITTGSGRTVTVRMLNRPEVSQRVCVPGLCMGQGSPPPPAGLKPNCRRSHVATNY